jgi:hypothetical protein
MPVTILTKNGTITPPSNSLGIGELAVDLATQKLYTSTDGINVVELLGSAPGGGLPAGTVTDSMLYWDGAAWIENVNVTVDPSGVMTGVGFIGPLTGDVAGNVTGSLTGNADTATTAATATLATTATNADSADAMDGVDAEFFNRATNLDSSAEVQPIEMQTMTQAEYDLITPTSSTIYYVKP